MKIFFFFILLVITLDVLANGKISSGGDDLVEDPPPVEAPDPPEKGDEQCYWVHQSGSRIEFPTIYPIPGALANGSMGKMGGGFNFPFMTFYQTPGGSFPVNSSSRICEGGNKGVQK